jgi:cytochrome bd ubiquinol oxidase subunit I
MEYDPLFLSRIQFAFIVSFHILFPAFTIGLANWIVVLEGLYLATGREAYFKLSGFWTKIFAISFGMGVVSGIVMSYQFGTNWSRWSDITGYVLGPLIQYEVVTAFFLEAAFLGILLFGRDRVPRGLHFFAASMVALGTLISSFWILSANSWMQTPAGFEIRDGRFFPTDWAAIVFNPSFPFRLMHMVTASFLTTSFVVAGISAWYLLKGRFPEHSKISFSMAIGLISALAPLQILFGLPDMEAEENHYEIAIPYLSSLILTHELEGKVPGLKDVPPDERPYVPIVFWAFRLMVGLGFVMLGVGLASLWLRRKRRLYEDRRFLAVCVALTPVGFVALLAGWFTTESGRQPYTVYGLLRTADSVTPALTGGAAMTSLVTFIVVYAMIFTAGTYYIVRLLKLGPVHAPHEDAPQAKSEAGRPKRPLSLPDERIEPAE